jgi:hypothetical protein
VGTSSITADRSLHLVDLENLVGDPFAPGPVALETFERYLAVAGWVRGDHLIVASNPAMMGKVVFDLPVACNMHAACGRDGADLKLLSLAPAALVARRYARLVVGSGDGIFAQRAQAVLELGASVLVVARADGCSGRLRRFEHRLLDAPVAVEHVLAA